MTGFIGLITGIILQAIAHHAYDASPGEGFLAYLIGFAIGMLVAREAREKL